MDEHDAEFNAATERSERRRREEPFAIAARHDRRVGRIVVTLNNGLEVMFSPRHAQGLEHAKPTELATIEISPSGLGLHWPALDADLYVPALLEGVFGSRRWMAAHAGAMGAHTSGAAKTAGARGDGRKGGRSRENAAE